MKPILAWDLHGVLFNLDYKRFWQLIGKTPHKIRLFLMAPQVLWYFYTIWQRTHVAEFIFHALQERFPLLQQVPFSQFANAQKPNMNMVALLENLKNKGYELVLASNIGPELYADLKKEIPAVFDLFSAAFIAQKSQNGTLEKRERAFYDNIQKYYPAQPIVLIDDKKHNIRLAKKVGILGILFKNMSQLKKELGCFLNEPL
ncbi:MAG: hypothetical protein WA432_03625 [Candidatus Babeliaceae bacterium]